MNGSLHDALRDRLVGGAFEPGQKLRAEVLKADYGVSASTMREVLLRLSAAGLVDFQEQRGFRLPLRSAALQHDLARFRIMLESEGAVMSIRAGGVAWEARLIAAHHKLSYIESRIQAGADEPGLLALWTAAELDFHRTLIEACGSAVLQETHLRTYYRFRQQLITSDREFAFVPENASQHRGILDAAIARDEAGVRERIGAHLSRNLVGAGEGEQGRA